MEVKEFLQQFQGQLGDILPREIARQAKHMWETDNYYMTPEIEKFIKEHYQNLKNYGLLGEDKDGRNSSIR